MNTIYQERKVAFHAPTFKDAVIILPLMDELVKVINHNKVVALYQNLPKEEKEQFEHMWINNNILLSTECIEKIYHLLSDLGFESQIDLKVATIDDLTKIR